MTHAATTDKGNGAIRVGILGFAHGHVGAYCRQWRARPELGIDICCGWDRDVSRRDRSCAELGIRAAPTPAAVVERAEVDAVVIGAETALHAELVETAAGAGKAIVLQKPIALTLAEADRMVAAVEDSGVPFTMAWQMRVDPQNLKIRELLATRVLGRPFMVRRRHGLPVCLDESFADSWHMAPEWNRDIWADDAAHPIDFVYWLFGRPASVTAEIVSLHNPRMPMDNGVAIFRYPDGPLVEVSCAFANRACENTTEVICEKGTIIQNYGDVPSCNVPRPASACGLKWFNADSGRWTCSEIPTPPAHGSRIDAVAEPVALFLHGARPPIATVAEGREVLRMVLACYVSVNDGRRVRLDDPAIQTV